MAARKVAVVTGSNKGIGFSVVRALCKKFDGDVFLTARDESRGREAVQKLEKEGLNPKFHQLDITDHASVVRLRDFLQQNYQGLDILVNNAALAYKNNSPAPFSEQAEVSLRVNFFSTLDVCEVLFPLLRPHARVSNVSSFVSQMSLSNCSSAMKKRFVDPNITLDELKELMTQFVRAAQENKHQQQGFSNSAYGMSKVGMTVLSIIQQREMDKVRGGQDIVINAVCPGWVKTDMSSHSGNLTPDQGAENPVYAALLPPNVDSPRGKFLREKKIAEWKM